MIPQHLPKALVLFLIELLTLQSWAPRLQDAQLTTKPFVFCLTNFGSNDGFR
jgi:hypothetical protein